MNQTSNSQNALNASSTNVLFMPSLFNETMKLLNDAREYFFMFGEDDQSRLTIDLRTLYSCEMSRITLRLSSIMAWLMVQRAVIAGKIPAADAVASYKLDFPDVCLVDNRMLHGVLPSYICYLLDNTLELYERVQRLDLQMRKLH